MILKNAIDSIHVVTEALLRKAEIELTQTLNVLLKANVKEDILKHAKFIEGEYQIIDDSTRPGQKVFIGADKFMGSLSKIMTMRYVIPVNKVMETEMAAMDGMVKGIIEELSKPMYKDFELRISGAKVILRTGKDDSFTLHSEIHIASSLPEEQKPEEKKE